MGNSACSKDDTASGFVLQTILKKKKEKRKRALHYSIFLVLVKHTNYKAADENLKKIKSKYLNVFDNNTLHHNKYDLLDGQT